MIPVTSPMLNLKIGNMAGRREAPEVPGISHFLQISCSGPAPTPL